MAKIATLGDPFSGSSLDAQWVSSGSPTSITVSGGLLSVVCTAGAAAPYQGIKTSGTWDLTGSEFEWELDSTTDTAMDVRIGFVGNTLPMVVHQTSQVLFGVGDAAGDYASNLYTHGAYQAFGRIVVDATDVIYYSKTNSGDGWTQRTSNAIGNYAALTAVTFRIGANHASAKTVVFTRLGTVDSTSGGGSSIPVFQHYYAQRRR